MRIAIDATCWWNQRGFGRFTRELLTALFALPSEHRFVVFIDRPPTAEMAGGRVEIVQVRQSRTLTEAAVADGSRSLRDLLAFSYAVAKAKPDLLFFPAVYSWFPVPPGLPAVVTLHDAIAERYPRLIFAERRSRLFWSLKMRLAIRQARRLITVSAAAKQEIVDFLGVDPQRIELISEAPQGCFRPLADPQLQAAARRRAGLPAAAPLLLYVGGMAPHKNIDGLLRGFAAATQRGLPAELRLALVGALEDGFHSHYRQLAAQVERDPRLRDRVRFTGYLPDQDLVALYSTALAVVLPSFSEGFGLPAVEALACGTPVLASERGSLPEVVGAAGLYFNPDDDDQIACAITRLASQPATRERLARLAPTQAAQFSWERAARQTLAVLEQSVGGR